MSSTVPSLVKSSGAPVAPYTAGMLYGIPSQPSAATIEGITPLRPAPRLVPAKVGPSGRAQTIYIECPTWCIVDHNEREGHLADVMHYGDGDVVQVLTLTDDDTAHSELYASISSDPSAADPRLRTGHIVVTDGASTDAYLTPEMADELANDLIAFASQIRHQARTVRLHNRAEGQA